MEKVKKYQSIILKVLREYAAIKSPFMPDVENKVVADTTNHHYLLVRMGWHQDKHVYHTIFHFDIINGKVWIQENRTDVKIDEKLVAAGIAVGDIIPNSALKKENNPKILYKYRDWNNGFHKNILLHNELYLASPKEMNDPFDCMIPSNFYLMDDNDLRDYFEKHLQQYIADPQNPKIDNDKWWEKTWRRRQDIETFQAENEKIRFEYQNNYFGVLSLSARWDSILMWSHYAASHTGFCVGFHEEHLRNSNLFGKGDIVKYDDDFPLLKPDADIEIGSDIQGLIERAFTVTYTKAIDWFYEKEYRFSKTFNSNNEPLLPFERVVKISDDCFAEVILGMNISNSNEQEIIKLCNQKNIPVFKVKKVPFKFELTKELISAEQES